MFSGGTEIQHWENMGLECFEPEILNICDALRDLGTLIHLKNVKNTQRGLILIAKLQAEASVLHGCFSRFLNCTNGTKLRKASHTERQLNFT